MQFLCLSVYLCDSLFVYLTLSARFYLCLFGLRVTCHVESDVSRHDHVTFVGCGLVVRFAE